MNIGSRTKGFVCGATAAATYGLNPLFTLPLYGEGMDADSVLFYRYGFAVLILGLMMKFQHQSFALKKKEILPLVIGGLLFSASSLLLYSSYNYMDAGIASTILFVYPVMVAVIMALFFHEKLSFITLSCIVLALSGIGLLYKGDGESNLSLVGMLLVILSSLSYAVYIVGVNQSSLKEMPTSKLTFYALLFGSSLYIVRTDFCMDLDAIPTLPAWGNILAMAFLPTVISLVCTAISIHHIGSTPTAILGALEPVTAVFFGVMIFGEQLTPRLIAGILMIITAVSFIVVGKTVIRKLNHLFIRKHSVS
ncbi:DMT family transporter [Parabacteroides pacaensis]|uniref:DMT family transporter n=1 Tax=Parabacteroides pacaensis TaxID=2086575 RepID=UPI000D10381E|nr:EamA family transporter [Parabacteroides pacaensis]